jgi:hypothetical protein
MDMMEWIKAGIGIHIGEFLWGLCLTGVILIVGGIVAVATWICGIFRKLGKGRIR